MPRRGKPGGRTKVLIVPVEGRLLSDVVAALQGVVAFDDNERSRNPRTYVNGDGDIAVYVSNWMA